MTALKQFPFYPFSPLKCSLSAKQYGPHPMFVKKVRENVIQPTAWKGALSSCWRLCGHFPAVENKQRLYPYRYCELPAAVWAPRTGPTRCAEAERCPSVHLPPHGQAWLSTTPFHPAGLLGQHRLVSLGNPLFDFKGIKQPACGRETPAFKIL